MIRTIAAVRATITALAFLVGVPVLLVVVGGSPLPSRMPSAPQFEMWLDDPLQPQYVPGTARTMVWLFWALLTSMIVTVWVLHARRWRWARLAAYLPGPVQGLTATLLGAATVTTAVGISPAHAASPAATSGTPTNGPTAAGDIGGHAPAATTDQRAHRAPAASNTVTVHRGDTLWDIAGDRLGDPKRWKQVYQLNTDRYPHMRGGGHIEPGWKLTLPTSVRKQDHRRPAPSSSTTAPAPSDARVMPPAGADRSVSTPSPSSADVSRAPDGAGPSRPAHLPSGHHEPPKQRTPPPGPRAQPSVGIDLPGGSWVDLGLAAAITAAAALVWAHRRRRYTHRPLSPDLRLDDPDLTPMPPLITQIRRRLHLAPDATRTAARSATALRTLGSSGTDPAEPQLSEDEPHPAGPVAAADEAEESARDSAPASVVRSVVPTLTNPAAVWPSSGLGLTGPGAESAARGFLVAALADNDPDAPPGHVLLPSSTAATLLGAAAVTLPSTPRLVVTDNLTEALNLLEQQILHRSRLVYAHEVDTVTTMRATDPYEEPTPPILLITDAATNHERTRITALLTQGQRLDIHGVLLGDWPAGDTISVDTDGTTTPSDNARPGRHPADVDRLAVLTPTETVTVITTLAEAHTGMSQPPPPIEATPQQPAPEPAFTAADADDVAPVDDAGRVLAALADLGDATAAAIAAHVDLPYPATTAKLVQAEHTGHAETTRTQTGQTLWRLTDTGRDALNEAATSPFASASADPVADAGLPAEEPKDGEAETLTADRYAQIGTVLQWPDPTTTFTSEHPPPPASDAGDDTEKPGRVEVTVLGNVGIVATNPDRRPRRKALELLTYLAVHDGSATVEAILDDLMPDAPASKAPERLYTYVSDLRAVMRRIGGPATYLTHPHQRYTLNPDTVDVDLWRMRAAIRHAHQTTDPQQRIDALQTAVDCYRGPLADGADYPWAESYREAIRQQALDAHLALADALTDDPAAQARVLEAAIRHSPYSEHLYQQAMRARAALGQLDAIRTLRRALGRALAEIDAEPSDDTVTLADQLITDLQLPRCQSH